MKKEILPELPSDPRLATVKRISKLMDEEFEIGGFKFGLDPILNFVPLAGDLGGYLVSVVLIFTMIKHGASGKVALKMAGNATLDALVGAIPILGWIFDFGYKANTRNVKLLTEHYVEGKHQGKVTPYLIPIMILFLIVLLGIIVLGIWAIGWIATQIDNQIGVKF